VDQTRNEPQWRRERKGSLLLDALRAMAAGNRRHINADKI
jgi:hypothetical protein